MASKSWLSVEVSLGQIAFPQPLSSKFSSGLVNVCASEFYENCSEASASKKNIWPRLVEMLFTVSTQQYNYMRYCTVFMHHWLFVWWSVFWQTTSQEYRTGGFHIELNGKICRLPVLPVEFWVLPIWYFLAFLIGQVHWHGILIGQALD